MADNMILGQDYIVSTDSQKTQLNNNVFICGGSGSGKTMSILEPRLLQTKESSLIVTLSKKRMAKKYAPYFLVNGYKVLSLNFADPEQSNVSFDPLAYVKTMLDANYLAKSIVGLNPKKEHNTTADPYWDDAATSLLLAEIGYVMVKKPDATFADVIKLHNSMKIRNSASDGVIRTTLDGHFDVLEDTHPDHYAVTAWKSFKQLPIKTASCVYSALNVVVSDVFTPPILDSMSSCPNVDFRDVADKKTVLFITTSAVNPSLNCYVNFFYAQAIKQLFEYAEGLPSGALPIPVHMLCDDFACGAPIKDFPEYISIFREKGISATILVQSESQLVSMYGEHKATTIIDNCDTYVYMGGMDLRTARNISARLNVPLEDVLYMPIGDIAIIRRGTKPRITQRYNIMEDTLYRKVTKAYEKLIKQPETTGLEKAG